MSSYPRNVLAERTRPLPALRFDINEVADILRMSRAQLYKRIAAGGIKEQLRARRRRERESLRVRQEQERHTFACTHREQRHRVRGLSQARRDGGIALALWALAAAREREVLQHRQAAERCALTETLPPGEVWRYWLERQAAEGDKAAQAALRGIRYRERRYHRQDGIAGEEISAQQQAFTVATLRAEVDASTHIIVYGRADGSEVFRDVGSQIVMRDAGDESL